MFYHFHHLDYLKNLLQKIQCIYFLIYSFGPTSSISKYNRQPKKSTFGTSSRRTYFDIVKREPVVYILIYLYRIKNNPLYRPI